MPRRKINVFGQPWEWQYKAGMVWDPQGKGHRLDLRTPFDYTGEYEGFALTPKKVLLAISMQFLGYTHRTGFPRGVLPEGHSIARKEGYELLHGPRGKWQIKVDNWTVHLISPEGFDFRPDCTSIFGKQWTEEMGRRVEEIYPAIKARYEPIEGRPIVNRDDRDAAWKQLVEELIPPKINYEAARRYIREHFGERVDA